MELTIKCGSCGRPRDDLTEGGPGEIQVAPKADRIPCPGCGATTVKATMIVQEMVTMSDAATGTATRGNTMRAAKVLDTENDVAYHEVMKFYEEWNPSNEPDWSVAIAESLVADCQRLETRNWRGRMYKARLNMTAAERADITQFEANRKGPSNPGRYNPGGAIVIYLADSPALARAENRPNAGDVGYTWTYDLDMDDHPIGILALDIEAAAPHLNALLFIAEVLADADDQEYGASFLVRRCAERAGLTGIQYPSCRGTRYDIKSGVNLVLWGDAVAAAEAGMEDTDRRPPTFSSTRL